MDVSINRSGTAKNRLLYRDGNRCGIGVFLFSDGEKCRTLTALDMSWIGPVQGILI